MKRAPRSTVILGGLVLLWISLAAFGYFRLGAYHARPGLDGSPPKVWPGQALVPRASDRPTLMMFVHPRCPCTSASMAGLAEVVARCRGRVSTNLVAYWPEGPAKNWDRSKDSILLDIPGMTRWEDRGGREAARFGVETSGHVLLYDRSGRLVFSGGITPSRGHQGWNQGIEELIAMILEESIGWGKTPVFGCPVSTPAPEGIR